MTRKPVVSGRFYPADPLDLEQIIIECENSSLGPKGKNIIKNGVLKALIQPHAGYMFSGPAAMWGIKRIELEHTLPEKYILLGPKHTPYGAKVAVSAAKFWKTPFGDVQVDEGLRKELLKTSKNIQIDDLAHAYEHSLEVQLPLLQFLYNKKKAEFKILPIAIGYITYEECCAIGNELSEILKKESNIVVLVSSDFSHETPKDLAYKLDSEAIKLIEAKKAEEFYNLVVTEDRSICGFIPITVALVAFKNFLNLSVNKLTYFTSMDVMPHPAGVGYASIAFEI